MKVSDYIMDYLYARGVTHIYEVIGGMITHLIDAAHRHGKLQLVSVHHEQAGAFAADAMARVTGVPGVAMATSGPGAINLLTGIGSCYFDSVPAVFITGQVNINEQKGTREVRQLGFQETDIVSMAKAVTKAAWRVEFADQIPSLLDKAFSVALSGRPGPVLLDVPMDVQRMDVPAELPINAPEPQPVYSDSVALADLLDSLNRAERPLILVGGGIHSAGAVQLARQFIELVQVPVVNSLMAVDVMPYGHPLRVGLIGSYGNRWANIALGTSDLLLVLGSRLDIRQTGADVESFGSGRKIFHVDCEKAEINNRIKGCRAIVADLQQFLPFAIDAVKQNKMKPHFVWLEGINKSRQEWPDTKETTENTGINPNRLMHQISEVSAQAGAYVVDVGNHQMWAAQSIETGPNQHFLTSGGMGSMGFALPAAIGACFGLGKQPVIHIAGDGGMQMNIQELQTIVQHHLPIKMIVLNNHSYGMVRQFQQSYFHDRYPSTYWGYSAPDFSRVAQAYGIESLTISKDAEIPGGLAALWGDPLEPFLLQVEIDPMLNAYPKIAFGYPITHMEPFTKPREMEGT